LVAVLAGGTGGAKLARGMLDLVEPGELAVVVNTADDVDVYGVRVSPDPDLVTYWLADLIDEPRGYGIRGDTWEVMSALERAGQPAWFRLGDRDLATCLARTDRLRRGETLTAATAAIARALGVGAAVLPMTDDEVCTRVETAGRWLPFQEFMVRHHHAGDVDGVEIAGIEAARPTAEVLHALASAEAIVIGPSNPVISIGPILATPGVRRAIADSRAPVVAVSPFVEGRVVKGPTAAFCAFAGLPLDARAVTTAYADVLDGVVADEALPAGGVSSLRTGTLMDSPERRRAVARGALELARSLTR
jgi:LPPG:FO 2-phospho-L-lactate transferase